MPIKVEYLPQLVASYLAGIASLGWGTSQAKHQYPISVTRGGYKFWYYGGFPELGQHKGLASGRENHHIHSRIPPFCHLPRRHKYRKRRFPLMLVPIPWMACNQRTLALSQPEYLASLLSSCVRSHRCELYIGGNYHNKDHRG